MNRSEYEFSVGFTNSLITKGTFTNNESEYDKNTQLKN